MNKLKKGLSKICWGKMRRGEKDVSPSPSIDHQIKNLPLAIKHWNLPLATKLGFSFTSFLLLLFKHMNLNHFGLSFPNITFKLNLEKNYSCNFPWEEKND